MKKSLNGAQLVNNCLATLKNAHNRTWAVMNTILKAKKKSFGKKARRLRLNKKAIVQNIVREKRNKKPDK